MAAFRQYEAAKATTGTSAVKKRKLEETASSDVKPVKSFRQALVAETLGKCSTTKTLSQAEFEDELARMLVEDMQPIATVERSGFQKFCSVVLPQFSLPSRRTTGRRLDEIYVQEKQKLLSVLSNTQWVSATADIWSAHKRAYMGVTIHFVQAETLQMVSSALVCRRFKGEHTGTRIARLLAEIFQEFQIEAKIQNVVTDNASNFAKAFNLFQNADDERSDEEALVVVNVNELLENACDDDSDDVPILPPHKRCGNHSLNLVASANALKAREDKVFQRSYDRAMAKVQALSNIVSRSPKANDTVEDITGKTFLKPTCTRWCSEYYAVERVVEIGLDKVVECETALGLSVMTSADMKFLTSFIKVMKPIVSAMKLIEGESHCYVGQLIPTIMGLQRKL